MSVSLLPAQLGATWLAFPAHTVQEILGKQPWIAIPSAAPEVPGVLAWRGRAIAIVDLGLISGAAAPLQRGELHHRNMVLQLEDCTFVVAVDRVREVQEVPGEELHPLHMTHVRYAAGEVKIDGSPMPVLDIGALVRAVSGARSGA